MTQITERDAIIDVIERKMMDSQPVHLPLTHRFTDGMYIREIFMPKGTLLTSSVHKTNHPYVVSKGKCRVFDGGNVQEIEAPYLGITQPNTRRLLYIDEDTIWTTFHATDKTDVDEIEAEIIEPHKNDLIDKEQLEQFHNISRGKNKLEQISKEDE